MRKNIFNDIKWFPVPDSNCYCGRFSGIAQHEYVRWCSPSIINYQHTEQSAYKKIRCTCQHAVEFAVDSRQGQRRELGKVQALCRKKIADYEEELAEFKKEQLGEAANLKKDITLFKFNDYAQQIIKDKYAITKLHDYIVLIQQCKDPKKLQKLNEELIHEFETRTKAYFYSNIEQVNIATIVEGGGRGQLRTYGTYLLQRKLKPVDPKISEKCKTVIDIITNNYQRTLKNHYHKNFGINLFLENIKSTSPR